MELTQHLISEAYAVSKRKTQEYFNVFDIAGFRETAVCRVMAELLSPQGCHYQGAVYLNLFVNHVLKMNVPSGELENALVTSEYQIDDKRRIDIVIETENLFIPIEVKIFAGEQYAQTADYLKFAKTIRGDAKIRYLTRFGNEPTSYSTKGKIPKEDLICISFCEDIINWLDACLNEQCTAEVSSIREIASQFKSTIKKVTGRMESQVVKVIKETITENIENLEGAFALADTVAEMKKDKIKEIFLMIDKKVGKRRMNPGGYRDYDGDSSDRFYEQKRPTFPGISYLYQENVLGKNDVDLWVRIEIDEFANLALGYCVASEGKLAHCELDELEIKKLTGLEELYSYNYWLYWEYVYIDDKQYQHEDTTNCPDFRLFNFAYFALYDKRKMEEIADRCARRLQALLHGNE